jgi:hypothetical protein
MTAEQLAAVIDDPATTEEEKKILGRVFFLIFKRPVEDIAKLTDEQRTMAVREGLSEDSSRRKILIASATPSSQ